MKHRVALSYVNVGIEHRADGSMSCRAFFEAPAAQVDWMQASVSQMRRGGVRLVVLSHGVNDDQLLPGAAGVEYLLRCFGAIVRDAEASDRCVLVRTKSDLDRAGRTGKIAVVLHLTGCPIGGPSPGAFHILDVLARLGVRSCHTMHHDEAIGAHWYAPGKVRGLSRYGRQLVREMEARHILVDVAHASDRAFRDFLRVARKPILDSHTACRSILDSMRNRTDAQLKAIAATGGVVGVHFSSALLAPVGDHPVRKRLLKRMQRQVRAMAKKYRDPYEFLAHRYDPWKWSRVLGGALDDGLEPLRATLEDLCDHLQHMVAVAGIDHVCVGSDYALGNICAGVETAAQLPNLVRALRKRGFRGEDLDKVMYANLHRLLRQSLPD